MARNKLIIGNWKMYKTLSRAVNDFSELVTLLKEKKCSTEVGIAAPSIFLSELSKKTANYVNLYAQNVHWESEGAFTGEISPFMLKGIRVAGSLIAHSERRQIFGESNKTAGRRMGALLRSGLKSVLCVGETLEERESGKLVEVIATQLREALVASGLRNSYEFIGSNPNAPLFSVAYEPVWAIGTGKSASPNEAQEVHKLIRQQLACYFNQNTANCIKVLYGGSVKPGNIESFLCCEDIDGALVGGASLVPAEFVKMCV
ncbi:MAG: triose-phosphate isomerase [Bdellovibrionota bacterium]